MRVCTTGYFNMVSIDMEGHPIPVPQLRIEDEQARAEWAVGEEMRREVEERVLS